ncbi:hypothetical protein GS425_05475 [Rhodococcus hoagii]|nr:hypothetical protein [Prescottella equi]
MAAQLREAAECPSNDWVIFWICRIARQCVVIEVANDLLAIAFDPAWHATMRAEAVNAFTAVAPRHQMAQLMPLLGLSSDEDPHDEILAAALRAMLPDVVDFAQVQNALRPRRSPNYFGSYAQLLIELPSLIPGNQILPALTDALDRRSERDDGAFDRLIGGLLQRAWQAKDPAICEAIGAALSTELLSAHQLFPNQLPPWQTDDDLELRRAMATSALATHPKAYYAVLEMRMLTPADLGWILDWMLIAPEPALEPARVALRNLAWNVADADSASRILDTDENHPAYEVLTTFRGHQELSARPDWLATENKEGPDLGQLESELRDAITHARNEIDDWWIVVVALVGDQTNLDTEVLFGWDLTSRPMWSTMTGEEQEEFLRLGLGYLRATQPDVSRWVGLDSFALDDVMPDWAGIFLLATIAAHRPDLLTNVAPSTWSAWASAIICTPNFTGAETWKRTIRDGAPEEGRDAIDAAFREQIEQADSTSFAYHPLANFSDKHLIAVVERLARDPR